MELRFTQQKRILFNEFSLFLVLDGYLLVLVEVALLHHRYEGRLNVLALQLLPIESCEPWVTLYLGNSIEA